VTAVTVIVLGVEQGIILAIVLSLTVHGLARSEPGPITAAQTSCATCEDAG
jgi:hypothetical protein